MMPQFLQTVLGYTAENAGLVLSGGGLVVLMEMPIVGMLAGKYPAKYIIAVGLAGAGDRDVCLHRAARHVDQFPVGCRAARDAISRARPSVRSRNNGGLHRDARRKKPIAWPASSTSCAISAAVWEPPWSRRCWRGARKFIRWCCRSIPLRSIRSLQNQVKALSLRLVHSGASVADAPKLAYGLLYRSVGGQA